MQSVLTENTDLLETKLVDILDEFQLPDDKTLSIVKEKEDNSLVLVTAKSKQSVIKLKTNQKKLPNWTVSSYDLGGHSPYFSSQKIFSSSSSFYFLVFSR